MKKIIKITTINYLNNIFIYRGIDENEKILFQNTINEASEGIAEFIGCVHALMYIKKNNIEADVYTNNKYIKKCVETKTFKYKTKSDKTNELLKRSNHFLHFDAPKTITIFLNKQNNEKTN